MSLRERTHCVLFTTGATCILMMMATAKGSAQDRAEGESVGYAARARGTVVSGTWVTDAPAEATRHRVLAVAVQSVVIADDSAQASRWRRSSSPAAFNVGPGQPSSRRSKARSSLIGAAIGGAVGVAGGVYVSQATGGDADPWAVPGFAGIGAVIGAITGLVVALF